MIKNAALYIAIQCYCSGIAWATTGVGKNALLAALAESMNYDYNLFIPSIHLPEDIGGVVDIDRENKKAVNFPMELVLKMTQPNQMLHIDEVNTAPQTMMPPLLSIINERKVDNIEFHPSTVIVCAANPPSIAPNAMPLAGSIRNRLYHHNWEFPLDEWVEGMTQHGGTFPTPTNFPVVGDFSKYVPKWASLIGNLVKRNRAMAITETLPEDEQAFPSPRMLRSLADCLAGADKVKHDMHKAGKGDDWDGHIFTELAEGCVGKNVAAQVAQWIAAMDLYDANDVINGKERVDYADSRIDQLCYLPFGILDALKEDHSGKRLDSATEVLIEMGENGLLDSVMPVLGQLSKTYSAYKVPKRLAARYGSIIAQLGA